MFGDTTSPKVTLFKILKTNWEEIDLQNIVLFEIPTCYRTDVKDLLTFIDHILEINNQPRGDYKEFLEARAS